MNLKKYFVIVSLFLALIGSIYIYIQYNLARYSIYYASHMPRKEGTNPELIMALKNIDFIDKPNTKNVQFHEDDNRSIYMRGDTYFTYGYGEYYLRLDKQNKLYFYNTDSTGKFITYSSLVDNEDEKLLNKENLEEIESIVSPAIGDIIKAQKTPFINLQKLFNQKYESIFN